MKYTRYDLKKNNKKNNSMFFLVLICIILILAFISGTMISNLFIKKPKHKQSDDPGKKAVQDIGKKNVREIDSFIIVQCGVFSNENNASAVKNKLKSIGDSFIVQDKGKNKVVLGIYSVKEFQGIEKLLKQNNIEFSKTNIEPNLNSKTDLQIAKIVDSELQIIHRFTKGNVKSIHTEKIKEWCSKLESVDSSEKNYTILNEMKNNIKNLPKEITKEKIEEINNYLYINIKSLQ